MSAEGYTRVADEQLDALESGPDVDLYNAVLDVIDAVFAAPGRAQSMSSAVRTADGRIVLRLPVLGHPPYKVFWTTDGPLIQAVFPHPG